MWAAVRRHAAPDERVANNPLFLRIRRRGRSTCPWALLSDRRSCFAGRELTLAYTALPRARREEIDTQFIRVFAGDASSRDVEELATRYDCRAVVVTAQDGAWRKDPFAASALYRLVEDDARWRIYRLAAMPRARRHTRAAPVGARLERFPLKSIRRHSGARRRLPRYARTPE